MRVAPQCAVRLPMLEVRPNMREGGLAGGDVSALMHLGVLRCDVDVAHAALKGGAVIHRRATGQRETRIDGTNTGGGDPGAALRTLDQAFVVVQRPGPRVAPMTTNLLMEKSASGANFRVRTTELELECLRIAHRPRRPQLLMSTACQLDQVIQCALGHPDIE